MFYISVKVVGSRGGLPAQPRGGGGRRRRRREHGGADGSQIQQRRAPL